MALFPIREAEILKLAETLVKGFTAHTSLYPAPPIANEELQSVLKRALNAKDAAVKARAAAEHATANKEAVMQELTEKMRCNLRYAENVARMDDGNLQLLGWGRPKRGRPPKAPGQARSLEISKQGDDWLSLHWKAPVDGGPVASYRIERRRHPDDLFWSEVGATGKTRLKVEGQGAGVIWEYRVVAVNKGGEGEPGNTVQATL